MAVGGSSTRRFVKTFLANKLANRGYPYFGSLEVTRRCNSRCAFCPIGNEKKEIKEGEAGTDAMKRVLSQFAEMNIIAVSFLGGEPFLRKDVCELAEYSCQRGMITQVSTNGLNLGPIVGESTAAFDVIVISLDATDAELYREIRGVDRFDTVLENIKAARDLSEENRCKILLNTVICSKNLEQVPDLIRLTKDLDLGGIMIDFATFHDYWSGKLDEKSRYNPEEMDWRNRLTETKDLVREIIRMKPDYPILTSRAYLETFLSDDLDFKCYPSLFCCVRRDGQVAIPCWDATCTKYFDIVNEHELREVWFSDEARELREKVADCSSCFMHCIVEPSKVLGATTRNLKDMVEWVNTFRSGAFSA